MKLVGGILDLLKEADSQLNDGISFRNLFQCWIPIGRGFIFFQPWCIWKHDARHFFIQRNPRRIWQVLNEIVALLGT